MVFPTNTTVIDNFNRASLGTNWTNVLGTLSIASSTVLAGRSSGALGYYNVSPFGPDVEVYARIPVLPGNSGVLYLFARWKDVPTFANLDGYGISITINTGGNDTIAIFRTDNSFSTNLATDTTHNISAGDQFGLSVIGNTIRGYLHQGGGWVEILSAADNTYPDAGYIGAGIVSSTGLLDNFSGGTATASGVTLAGSISFSFTSTGVLHVGKPLAAQVAAAFSAMTQLAVQKTLTGQISVAFLPVATLHVEKTLGGAMAGVFGVAGSLAVQKPLSAAIPLSFLLTGDLLSGGGLAASITLAVNASALLQVEKRLAASSLAIFTPQGLLQVQKHLSGGSPLVFVLSGVLSGGDTGIIAVYEAAAREGFWEAGARLDVFEAALRIPLFEAGSRQDFYEADERVGFYEAG